MWEMSARQWKEDVLDAANDKFERRLSEESGALRLEMAAVRLEIARSHASLLRWQFGFWLTQMLAIVAMAMKISAR
jgi:hypothetical protein